MGKNLKNQLLILKSKLSKHTAINKTVNRN